MINQVTQSLEAFFKQPGLAPPLRDAAIRFERPTDPYALDQDTVNVFLFEVRENLDLRANNSVTRRAGGQSIVTPPALRVNCLYLVTAWPVSGSNLPLQEHELLAQAMQLVAGAPSIPQAFLTPQLQLQEPALPMALVQPDSVRNPAEFWAAIGNRLKPSLMLSVTVALTVFDSATWPTVTSSEFRLGTAPPGAGLDAPFFQIGGTIVDAGALPVFHAGVTIVERGRSTLTDAAGRFSLSAIPAGNFTLRVTAGGATVDRAIVVPAPASGAYDVQLV